MIGNESIDEFLLLIVSRNFHETIVQWIISGLMLLYTPQDYLFNKTFYLLLFSIVVTLGQCAAFVGRSFSERNNKFHSFLN